MAKKAWRQTTENSVDERDDMNHALGSLLDVPLLRTTTASLLKAHYTSPSLIETQGTFVTFMQRKGDSSKESWKTPLRFERGR